MGTWTLWDCCWRFGGPAWASYEPLLWAHGVCSMGPYLVYGIYLVCIGVQVKGLYLGSRDPLCISGMALGT